MRGGSHQPAPIHQEFKCKLLFLFSPLNLLSYRHNKIAWTARPSNYTCGCLTKKDIKLLFVLTMAPYEEIKHEQIYAPDSYGFSLLSKRA